MGLGFSRETALRITGLSNGFQGFLGKHCGSDSYKQGKVIRRGSKGKSNVGWKQSKIACGFLENWRNQNSEPLELKFFNKLRNLNQKGYQGSLTEEIQV